MIKGLTVDSVNTHAEWFFAGFSRVTWTPTDKDDRSEVYNVSVPYGQAKVLKLTSSLKQWVRRTLTKEGLIVKKNRPKHLFSEENLAQVLLALWIKNDLIFIHECNRIQFAFIFTSIAGLGQGLVHFLLEVSSIR